MKKRGMSKSAFIFFLIIVFSVIALAIIFFLSKAGDFNSDKYLISYDSLAEGVEIPLTQNTILVIDYQGKNNSLFLNDFSEERVYGSHLSKEFILKVSEPYRVDLDKDGSSDIELILSKNEGIFYLEISSLNVFECEEDWVCSDWTPCLSEEMKRVCVDNNLCGTFEHQPETFLAC